MSERLAYCDGGITATVEEHVVQWNPVVLRILSWRREEEKKLKERNLRRRRRNSHCISASARSAGETRPKTGQVTSMLASAVTLIILNSNFSKSFIRLINKLIKNN